MRFYEIQIAAGGVAGPGATATGTSSATFSSFPNGVGDPNALNIEMDIPLGPFATPLGGSFVRIWGVSLQQISQSANFNGAAIKVYGGMKAGLPLANQAQSGLLFQGTVWQAFGNWIGTSMSLDLIIIPSFAGPPDAVQNITWAWTKGTPMSDAIASTLKTMSPNLAQTINISPNLILTEDDTGIYGSLYELSQHVKATSLKIIGGTTYAGVDISQQGNTLVVDDGTVKTTPKQIMFNDLIGQPTWIGPNQIQLNCVMRADVSVNDLLKMPVSSTGQAQTPVVQSQQTQPRYQDKSVFQGMFRASLVRHVGNFRQPDATSWITTIEAFTSV